jgi:methyltransferase (TIGR00027 family)
MQAGEPSRTAFAAAVHRAAHQLLEQERIFADPLALRILGEDGETVMRRAEDDPLRRGMRFFIAARTRLAEDALAAAVEHGAAQLVVLGAGLDTFAYRNPFEGRLRVFEVDHPATQAWKRKRLEDAGIAIPASLTFAPIDFERETLSAGLAASGFYPERQSFFTWLGVVPYLTPEAMWATLDFIAKLPAAAHVIFDYSDPPNSLSARDREAHDRRAARVASLGEAWLNYLSPSPLRAGLLELGFTEVEDLGPPEIAARFFPNRAAAAPSTGGHILRASTFTGQS